VALLQQRFRSAVQPVEARSNAIAMGNVDVAPKPGDRVRGVYARQNFIAAIV
jgi:hypothetical protein